MSVNHNIIQENGPCVLISDQIRGGVIYNTVAKNRKVTLKSRGKQGQRSLGSLVGQSYGRKYSFDNDKNAFILQTGNELEDIMASLVPDVKDDDDVATSNVKDNRNYTDRTSNQDLTAHEINQLSKGRSAAEMLELLTRYSNTYDSKTEFSKTKYLKKKLKKYSEVVDVLKPTLQLICDLYLQQNSSPQTVCLRHDSLARMLSLANVQANNSTMIIGASRGVLLAAAVERHQGYGTILHGYDGHTYKKELEASERLGLINSNIYSNVSHFPLNILLKQNELSNNEIDSKIVAVDVQQKINNQVDSILIAHVNDPFPMLLAAWPYLCGSGGFAVFCPVIEPLVELRLKLVREKSAVFLKITETFFRIHQVLENRTHPNMNMHGTSGFVLSGYKVV